MVDRQAQLRELEALARASRDAARVAWLVGAEGVGKSTLAQVAAERSGLRAVRLDLYPEDREVPLGALQELASLLEIPLGANPAQELLRGLERSGPLCLLIEDAQWMDDASQNALWQVVRRFRRLPIWLLVTSTETRGTLLDGLALLLRSPERGRVITVLPFTQDQVSEFLQERLGVPLRGEPLEQMAAITGGYPALLVSLVDQLLMAGRSVNLRTALHALAETSGESGLLQSHASAVMAAASPSERAALIALAQSGDLSPTQLSRVLRRRGLADVSLDTLRASGLVDRTSTASLRVRHTIAQRKIIELATWAESFESHATLGAVLSGLDGLHHRVAAATEDTREQVLVEVIGQLRQAYQQHDMSVAFQSARLGARLDPALMIEVVLAAMRWGRLNRLGDVEDRIRNLPPSVTRTATLTILDLDRLGFVAAADRLSMIDPRNVEDARELIVLAYAVVHVSTQAVLQTQEFVGRRFMPLIDALGARAEQLKDLDPERATELAINARSLEMLLVHLLNDDVPPAQRITPLERLAAEAAGLPLLEPMARILIGLMRFAAGDLAGADRDLTLHAIDTIPFLRMQGDLCIVLSAFLRGEWDEAHSRANLQLTATLDALDSGYWEQTFSLAALVPACRGEAQVAQQYLGWKDDSAVVSVADACHRTTLAWQAVALGTDPENYARLLDQVWEAGLIGYVGGFATAVLRARGHVAAGDLDAARAAQAAAEHEPYEATAAAYAHAHIAALIACGEGDAGMAAQMFAEAHERLRVQFDRHPGGELRLMQAVLAEDWAEAIARGIADDQRVLAPLGDAISMLAACGALTWRARLVSLQRRIAPGNRPPAATSAQEMLAVLTTREREVVGLVAEGLSNKEIAERLFVTVRTAEFHVHNALAKSGLPTRQELRRALAGNTASAS